VKFNSIASLMNASRTLAPLALLLAAAILVGCASPTIATVNGETITAEEFQDRFQFDVLVATGGRGLDDAVQTENAAQVILSTMISEKIARQKAEELGLTVSDLEYRTALAEFPNLEELVTVIVENTEMDEETVRDLWRQNIEGRILMKELAEYYDTPEADLVKQWNEEADWDVNDNWKVYIPAN
jgi:parvulin-like peptidyl-prolyl isomerase